LTGTPALRRKQASIHTHTQALPDLQGQVKAVFVGASSQASQAMPVEECERKEEKGKAKKKTITLALSPK